MVFGKKKVSPEVVPASFKLIGEEIKRFKEDVSGIKCPACGQFKLIIEKYEQGPKGWAAAISCGNCAFQGSFTQEGFSFTEVSSEGKAVKNVKPEPKVKTTEQ